MAAMHSGESIAYKMGFSVATFIIAMVTIGVAVETYKLFTAGGDESPTIAQ